MKYIFATIMFTFLTNVMSSGLQAAARATVELNYKNKALSSNTEKEKVTTAPEMNEEGDYEEETYEELNPNELSNEFLAKVTKHLGNKKFFTAIP